MRLSSRTRTVIAAAAAAAMIAPVGWMWLDSLPPETYSVTEMGRADYGGGSHLASHGHSERDVASFTESTAGEADVSVTLTARKETFRLASGRAVDGYTLNGASPGPVIRAQQGQLVEVLLVNRSVPEGVSLHWHGIDVPNAVDGVAGVTQDAVPIGGEFTYRFKAEQAGTYWYHSHQSSHRQVPRGLLGAVLITPGGDDGSLIDMVALVHLYGGERTINGQSGDVPVEAAPGTRMRVRVVNTDNGPMPVWVSGSAYRVVAVDGTDVTEPELVSDTALLVTAGGRADLEVVVPESGARVEMGGSAALVLGDMSPPVPADRRPVDTLDLLSYGSPTPIGFDPDRATRRFEYAIGRRPGFVRGMPGMWWTINGNLYPETPMFMVREGNVVRVRISNTSGEVHPMHLHGHHAVVLSYDGVSATGSPWWVDSLNVADGETYEVAFVADNPGVWMFHCHHLGHAADGFVAHLMYEGVTVPYVVGAGNEPE